MCNNITAMKGILNFFFICTALVSINALVIPRRYRIISTSMRSTRVNNVKPQLTHTDKIELKKLNENSNGEKRTRMNLSRYSQDQKRSHFLGSLTVSLNQEGTKTEKRYVYLSVGKKIYAKRKEKGPKSPILSLWG